MISSAPSSLAHLQQLFVESVSGDRPRPLDLIPAGTLSPAVAIEVYRQDYRLRMLQTLGEMYETFWSIVGDELFQKLAFDYLKAYPSAEFNLSGYGFHFPEFAQSSEFAQNDDLAGVLPILHFERAFWRLFHLPAPQTPILLSLLGNDLPLESALKRKWTFESTVHFYQSDCSIWGLFMKRKQLIDEAVLAAHGKAEWGLLFRQGPNLQALTLSQPQWQILKEMQAGSTPEQAISNASGIQPQEIQQLFSHLATLPLIQSVQRLDGH